MTEPSKKTTMKTPHAWFSTKIPKMRDPKMIHTLTLVDWNGGLMFNLESCNYRCTFFFFLGKHDREWICSQRVSSQEGRIHSKILRIVLVTAEIDHTMKAPEIPLASRVSIPCLMQLLGTSIISISRDVPRFIIRGICA